MYFLKCIFCNQFKKKVILGGYNSLISNIDEPILVLTCDNIVNINFLPYFEEFNKLTNCECLLVPAYQLKI